MAQSIKNILGGNTFSEPEEIRIIKNFVQEHYQSEAQVTVRKTDILIGVRSAALASALRPQLFELKERCKTDKRLVLRIGIRKPR